MARAVAADHVGTRLGSGEVCVLHIATDALHSPPSDRFTPARCVKQHLRYCDWCLPGTLPVKEKAAKLAVTAALSHAKSSFSIGFI